MRLSIEISVNGSTISEIISRAVEKWNSLSGENLTTLPSGSEIDIQPSDFDVSQYTAKVFIRTKVEENA